jgi:hypothetical protein
MASIIIFKLKRLLLLKLHFIDLFFKLLETEKNLLKICSFLIVFPFNSNLFLIVKFFINLTKKWGTRGYYIILISLRNSSSLMMISSSIMTNLQRSSYILITTFFLSKIDSYKISITYNFSKEIQIIQGNLIEKITIIFKVLVEN